LPTRACSLLTFIVGLLVVLTFLRHTEYGHWMTRRCARPFCGRADRSNTSSGIGLFRSAHKNPLPGSASAAGLVRNTGLLRLELSSHELVNEG
jgi:hypothetical protein